jgi:serine/threonine-protein kinase
MILLTLWSRCIVRNSQLTLAARLFALEFSRQHRLPMVGSGRMMNGPDDPGFSAARRNLHMPMDDSPVSDTDAEQRGVPHDAADLSESTVIDAQSPGENAPTTSGSASAPTEFQDRMLGEFHLLRRLGKGGMADVYLAEQTSLKRQVAIKILRRDVVDDSDDVLLKRFAHEATAAAALSHPNIVQVYSIGEEDGIHYIAQEYVQGSNLREFIQRKGPPDLPVAIHIMTQVAAALQAAGEAGIVHRDIKPENILITRKGDVKVADFGLAQLTQGGERVSLTQVGITMGTPLYMSPEQVNGHKLDVRSDLYSFGVTCWHMLAGRPPFRGETALAVAVMHLNETAPPLDQERPDLPRSLCELVISMMAKKPDARPTNAATVCESLERLSHKIENTGAVGRFAAGEFDVSVTRPKLSTVMQLVRQPIVRHMAVFMACCLVVGGISAGVGVWLRPGSPFDGPHAATARKIHEQDTVALQVYHAMLRDDRESWQAVVEYFPEATREVQRAHEHLARLHLREQRFDEAENIYQEFASRSADPETMAHGLAGLAAVASLKGEYLASQRLIADELLPLRNRLDDEMERLFRETLTRNLDHLSVEDRKRFEALFESELGDDPAPPGS